jgi:hypothetical protein
MQDNIVMAIRQGCDEKWVRAQSLGRSAAVSKTSRSALENLNALAGSSLLRLVPCRYAPRNTAALPKNARSITPHPLLITPIRQSPQVRRTPMIQDVINTRTCHGKDVWRRTRSEEGEYPRGSLTDER